ncbi:MAG: DUF262 domain-containing HNH endonuclease family protein [Novosphingobium sp.]|nr:DUF262 domain-containing HNH endonuclease family protein [Novosphingobium sp.]
MSINAEVLRIRDVFSVAADIRVPPFQRSFSWGDEETGILIKDLLDAFRNSVIYFLGAMVVIRPRGRGPQDVVDGQQRATTLTIILAVLRDLSNSADEQALLHTMIGHEGMGMMFGGGHRWRITLNTLDTPFFREHVQMRGATNDQDRIRQAARGTGSESQARLADAVNLIYDELSDMSQEERSRFAQWLLDEVSIVRVRVSEYAVAYKVFQSLNHRGKPLSDHDILKSALFERAGFTNQEAIEQSVRWNTYTNRLSDRGFGDMLKQVRAIYDRQGTGELVDGLLQSIMQMMPVGQFLNEKLPLFVDAYDAVVRGNTEELNLGPEALKRICHLRSIHHESWRAPAIMFLVDHPHDPETADRFFWALDRLAYTLQYSIADREYRQKRYRRVLDAMDRHDELFDADSPLDLSTKEKADLIERLRGRFPNFKQRRALLMRISSAVPTGQPLLPDTDCTVEHILPRTPPKGSDWYDEWSRAKDRDELTECIGNFTLLTHAENQEADRKSFLEKLGIYFRKGSPSFAMSDDLKGRTRWTPDDVRARREQLIAHLAKDWALQ